VVVSPAAIESLPAPLALPSNGMMPVVNELVALVVEALLIALTSGPRMRTCLVSMGAELAAIIGVTVTVAVVKFTLLDAAKLKSIASWDAPLEVTLNEAFGSNMTVSWSWPKAWPFAPTGFKVTPFRLPLSYTICAEL
jgi:hypothetical protein